eukprot:s1085_g12.t1
MLAILQDALLQQLSSEELGEFAAAHAACAELLGSGATSQQHGRCAVQACRLTNDVEVRGRSALAWRLAEEGKSEEALAVLKEAQALDPQNTALRDQAAKLNQQDGIPEKTRGRFELLVLVGMDSQSKSVTTLEALKSLKHDLNDSLEAKDVVGLKALLEELDALPLTWEAAAETKIGKEVGLCAKLSDPAVADLSKSIIARLHKLAKQERPLWVR